MNAPQHANDLVTLRRFAPADAKNIQLLADDAAIAEMTLTIPHPYPDGAAEEWIAKEEARFAEGEGASFAITDRREAALVGCIGVKLDFTQKRPGSAWKNLPGTDPEIRPAEGNFSLQFAPERFLRA